MKVCPETHCKTIYSILTASRQDLCLLLIALLLVLYHLTSLVTHATANEENQKGTLLGSVVIQQGSCGNQPIKAPPCQTPPYHGPLIPFEIIQIENKSSPKSFVVRTDKNGKFSVSLPEGHYKIKLSMQPGPFRYNPETVNIERGKTIEKIIQLMPIYP